MILALASIATFVNLVWAHRMFTVGMEIETNIYFTVATLIIAVPTGTKLYNWLSMFNTHTVSPLLTIVLLFIIIFISGGCTGLILANNVIDLAFFIRNSSFSYIFLVIILFNREVFIK